MSGGKWNGPSTSYKAGANGQINNHMMDGDKWCGESIITKNPEKAYFKKNGDILEAANPKWEDFAHNMFPDPPKDPTEKKSAK